MNRTHIALWSVLLLAGCAENKPAESPAASTNQTNTGSAMESTPATTAQSQYSEAAPNRAPKAETNPATTPPPAQPSPVANTPPPATTPAPDTSTTPNAAASTDRDRVTPLDQGNGAGDTKITQQIRQAVV